MHEPLLRCFDAVPSPLAPQAQILLDCAGLFVLRTTARTYSPQLVPAAACGAFDLLSRPRERGCPRGASPGCRPGCRCRRLRSEPQPLFSAHTPFQFQVPRTLHQHTHPACGGSTPWPLSLLAGRPFSSTQPGISPLLLPDHAAEPAFVSFFMRASVVQMALIRALSVPSPLCAVLLGPAVLATCSVVISPEWARMVWLPSGGDIPS
jgi:hypothetical protein